MTPFGMYLFSASLSPTTSWLPTTPIEAFMVLSTPEIKLYKMAGNSANYPFNSRSTERPCVTTEWWTGAEEAIKDWVGR